ncbi:hypothetical protein [Halanaerobaculum tunisiense]
MKIGTISDLLLIVGDILYHGARNPLPAGYDTPAVVEELNQMEDDFLAIKGNVDTVVEDNGRRIAMYHDYQHETKEERVDFA